MSHAVGWRPHHVQPLTAPAHTPAGLLGLGHTVLPTASQLSASPRIINLLVVLSIIVSITQHATCMPSSSASHMQIAASSQRHSSHTLAATAVLVGSWVVPQW